MHLYPCTFVHTHTHTHPPTHTHTHTDTLGVSCFWLHRFQHCYLVSLYRQCVGLVDRRYVCGCVWGELYIYKTGKHYKCKKM